MKFGKYPENPRRKESILFKLGCPPSQDASGK